MGSDEAVISIQRQLSDVDRIRSSVWTKLLGVCKATFSISLIVLLSPILGPLGGLSFGFSVLWRCATTLQDTVALLFHAILVSVHTILSLAVYFFSSHLQHETKQQWSLHLQQDESNVESRTFGQLIDLLFTLREGLLSAPIQPSSTKFSFRSKSLWLGLKVTATLLDVLSPPLNRLQTAAAGRTKDTESTPWDISLQEKSLTAHLVDSIPVLEILNRMVTFIRQCRLRVLRVYPAPDPPPLTPRTMSIFDRFWLYDGSSSPCQITALQTIEAMGVSLIKEALIERLVVSEPKMNCRPSPYLLRWCWVPVDNFNFENHLKVFVADLDVVPIDDMVSSFSSTRLPMSKPPWRFVVIQDVGRCHCADDAACASKHHIRLTDDNTHLLVDKPFNTLIGDGTIVRSSEKRSSGGVDQQKDIPADALKWKLCHSLQNYVGRVCLKKTYMAFHSHHSITDGVGIAYSLIHKLFDQGDDDPNEGEPAKQKEDSAVSNMPRHTEGEDIKYCCSPQFKSGSPTRRRKATPNSAGNGNHSNTRAAPMEPSTCSGTRPSTPVSSADQEMINMGVTSLLTPQLHSLSGVINSSNESGDPQVLIRTPKTSSTLSSSSPLSPNIATDKDKTASGSETPQAVIPDPHSIDVSKGVTRRLTRTLKGQASSEGTARNDAQLVGPNGKKLAGKPLKNFGLFSFSHVAFGFAKLFWHLWDVAACLGTPMTGAHLASATPPFRRSYAGEGGTQSRKNKNGCAPGDGELGKGLHRVCPRTGVDWHWQDDDCGSRIAVMLTEILFYALLQLSQLGSRWKNIALQWFAPRSAPPLTEQYAGAKCEKVDIFAERVANRESPIGRLVCAMSVNVPFEHVKSITDKCQSIGLGKYTVNDLLTTCFLRAYQRLGVGDVELKTYKEEPLLHYSGHSKNVPEIMKGLGPINEAALMAVFRFVLCVSFRVEPPAEMDNHLVPILVELDASTSREDRPYQTLAVSRLI
eukprot:GHVN01069884.1.p1 GENE.GHVN01069884.1~~GHVN01069884.1.p1  ORF type:complete len:977 (+),score=99.64 GHVN01069884.1:1336-4266(+)